MSETTAPTAEWVSARAAAKILGVHPARVFQVAILSGRVRIRTLPGERTKFSRPDLEALEASSTARPDPSPAPA